MKEQFCIVLVRPRDPNNIGAVARAMANFGLQDLRVVDPFPPTWQEVVSAVGAHDILTHAKLFSALPQALADCQTSLATTSLKNRQLHQTMIALPDLPAWLEKQNPGKTALVFGNEKTGLSNEDIELCSAAVHIPTTAKQPSVNLAQAVILLCYELARRPLPFSAHIATKATFEQTELVIQELEGLMQAAHLKADFSQKQRQDLLRSLLNKSNFSKNELFFIKKFAKQLAQVLPQETKER